MTVLQRIVTKFGSTKKDSNGYTVVTSVNRWSGSIVSNNVDSKGTFKETILATSSTAYDETKKNSDGLWYTYLGIE